MHLANKVAKSYGYDEFGNTKDKGDASFKNSVKFKGAVHDQSTGLYYMNSRFYNPSTGRFLTQDSYKGEANAPWTQHLYAYCGNSPVTMIDPTGHMFISGATEGGGDVPDEGESTYKEKAETASHGRSL